MYIPWKLISFWMNVLAWLSVIAAVIAFFVFLAKSPLFAFEIFLSGGVGFVFWKGMAIMTKAAETYLSTVFPDETETDDSEE